MSAYSFAFPELTLFLGGCLVLVLGTLKIPARYLHYGSVAILLLVAVQVWGLYPEQDTIEMTGLYDASRLTAVLQIGMLLACAAALAYSGDYLSDRKILNGEYLSLALFAATGMMLMAAASHYLTVYLGLELMSLSLYAMIASQRNNARAIEAAMKYFVLGGLASGVMLYGMSMMYAATGTLSLAGVAQGVVAEDVSASLVLIGIVFMIAGVAFKLGAAPFHMWLPDVYDGAPTAVTLFVGSAPKIAAFAMAIRIVSDSLGPVSEQWAALLAFLAIASLGIGNVLAIAQTNIKRMLAYSTISHMGFLLTGMVAGTADGYAAAMFYVLTYALMTLGGFGMLVLLSQNGKEAELLSDMRGLGERSPIVGALVLILMLSMAGVPPLVGFYAKLAVWSAAVEAGWAWLAVVAGVFSVVGAFYYLRVVKLVCFDKPEDASPITVPAPYLTLACLNGLLVVILGLLPGGLLAICARVFLDT